MGVGGGGLGGWLVAPRWGGGGEVGVADGEEVGVEGGYVVVLGEGLVRLIGEGGGLGEVLFCRLL